MTLKQRQNTIINSMKIAVYILNSYITVVTIITIGENPERILRKNIVLNIKHSTMMIMRYLDKTEKGPKTTVLTMLMMLKTI
jgi:hypothetical protein